MRPTLALTMQRVWHRTEPLTTAAIGILPGAAKLVLFRALARALRIRSVSVDGVIGPFEGDPLDLGVISEYMLSGRYSPALLKYLRDWFSGGDGNREGTLIDIGANIGLTSVPLARAGIDCLCFEPDRRNFEFLRQNTRDLVSAGRVRLFNAALFDSESDLEFEISDWNYGDHRVRRVGTKGAFGEENRTVTTVPARRLDDVVDLEEVRRPLAIKIDTQGAEVNVVRGGQKVIASADLLSLEFCPYLVRRMGEHEESLIEFVSENFGYGCVANWHASDAEVRFVEIGELAETLRRCSRTVQTTRHWDLLLTKSR